MGAMQGPEHTFVWENLHAYALDALDEGERERVERHLKHCTLCQHEVLAWFEVTHKLALAVPFYDPPVTLRATIRQLAAGTANVASPPSHPAFSFRVPRIWQRPYAFLSALLVLVLGLTGWNIHLHQRMTAMASAMAEADEMETLFVEYVDNPSVFEHFTLDGPNGTRVHLLYSGVSNRVALVADGLPWQGEQTEYTLWFYTAEGDGFKVTAFRCDRTGRAVVVLESPLPLERVIEVAIMPANATNPGHPILNGRLRRREGLPVFLAQLPL